MLSSAALGYIVAHVHFFYAWVGRGPPLVNLLGLARNHFPPWGDADEDVMGRLHWTPWQKKPRRGSKTKEEGAPRRKEERGYQDTKSLGQICTEIINRDGTKSMEVRQYDAAVEGTRNWEQP